MSRPAEVQYVLMVASLQALAEADAKAGTFMGVRNHATRIGDGDYELRTTFEFVDLRNEAKQ